MTPAYSPDEIAALLPFLTAKERAELDKLLIHETDHGLTLTEFKRRIFKRYEHAAHLEALDQALAACTRHVETLGAEGIGHLIVSMPPRHGKTQTIGMLYPAWHLGRNPDHRIIMVGYGSGLVVKSSRAVRNFIASPRYRELFPHVGLAADSRRADAWNIAENFGGMDAMGIGGGTTGKGGHLIIVDDPIRKREEAESAVYRDKTYSAFTSDLYTRREPGAAVIIVMTRWHQDDLVGRLLKHDPEKWHVLRFPALAEAGDPLGRAEGDPLWAERIPLKMLMENKATLSAYEFAGLYQQSPVPSEGGLFKRAAFNVIDQPPKDITRRARFWDLAMSSRTSADYTVGVLMGITAGGRLVVLDVMRAQREAADVPRLIIDTALMDGVEPLIGIEDAFYFSRIIGDEVLKAAALHKHTIRKIKPEVDKVTRALPFAARVGAGMVDVLDRHWTREFLEEMASFPMGVHDDQVDAASGAYTLLGTRQGLKVETSRYA